MDYTIKEIFLNNDVLDNCCYSSELLIFIETAETT